MPQLSVPANGLRQGVSRIAASPRLLALHRATIVPQIPQYATLQSFTGTAHFSSTPRLLKGKTKVERDQDTRLKAASTPVDDPFDFSPLNAGIDTALSKLQKTLKSLNTGGRFNIEVLENVRVHLEKNSKKSFKLGDLAQIIPTGRKVMLIVGEKDHIKPITSAIQGAEGLNLQPQPDPHNPSQLVMTIPPPTRDTRELALSAAHLARNTAIDGVRYARATMQKKLRAIELKKAARPDDLNRAYNEMKKIHDTGVADVKKAVDAAIKTMEQT